jgi:hypothetical protein
MLLAYFFIKICNSNLMSYTTDEVPVGSTPISSFNARFLAYSRRRHSSVVEHFIGNEEVSGSSPDGGSIFSFDILTFSL